MRIKKVTNIDWLGGQLSAYVLLRDGNLTINSIVLPPTLYLLETAKAGIADESMRARAQDMVSFFSAMEKKSIDWRQLTNNQLSGYLNQNLQLERQLSPISIKRHISSIKGFYLYAESNGLLESSPSLLYQYINVDSFSSCDQEGIETKFKLIEKYINKTIFNLILTGGRSNNQFIRERDELVLHLGYECGLRTHEITYEGNLDTRKLRKIITMTNNKQTTYYSLPIIGKGGKLRTVDFNSKICKKIKLFLEGRRGTIPDGPLICSNTGKALSPSHGTRVFKTALNTALPRLQKKIKEAETSDTNEFYISFSSAKKLTYHTLRHTYATNLATFCEIHNMDKWSYIPQQMGHSKKETTETYIVFEAKIHNRDLMRNFLNIEDN